MRSTRALTGVLAIGALTLASLFAASPASAATLPSGQRITTVDYYTWQSYDVRPADAALTYVGGPEVYPQDENVTATDVDDDGHGYAFVTAYEYVEDGDYYEPVEGSLHPYDATTGEVGPGMKMTISYGDPGEETEISADECTAIDYTAGVVIGVCYNYDEGAGMFIGIVDTENAILHADTWYFADGYLTWFTAIALDPTTGILWGMTIDDEELYTITLDGNEPQYVDELEYEIWGADFDRDGKLWVTAYDQPTAAVAEGLIPARAIEDGEGGIAILDPASATFPFTAAWPDVEFAGAALTVWGKPVLPATGPSDLSFPVVGGALLLLAGTILAGVTVLRRRSQLPLR